MNYKFFLPAFVILVVLGGYVFTGNQRRVEDISATPTINNTATPEVTLAPDSTQAESDAKLTSSNRTTIEESTNAILQEVADDEISESEDALLEDASSEDAALNTLDQSLSAQKDEL